MVWFCLSVRWCNSVLTELTFMRSFSFVHKWTYGRVSACYVPRETWQCYQRIDIGLCSGTHKCLVCYITSGVTWYYDFVCPSVGVTVLSQNWHSWDLSPLCTWDLWESNCLLCARNADRLLFSITLCVVGVTCVTLHVTRAAVVACGVQCNVNSLNSFVHKWCCLGYGVTCYGVTCYSVTCYVVTCYVVICALCNVLWRNVLCRYMCVM